MADLKVYYCSDVHNDIHEHNALLDMPGDKNAILVVAGDVNSKGRMTRDLDAIAERWRAVIAVPGNHDWWGLALHETHKFESQKDNVHILINDTVIIDDVTFVGTTLWHQIKDWFEGSRWKDTMNDARKIRGHDYRRLYGEDLHVVHQQCVDFIEKCTTIEGKKVLVTHHAMSSKSIDPRYAYSASNSFYYTPLEHLLEHFDFHIHGHIHCEKDYYVGKCNVVCNPHGYFTENPDYDVRILDV